MVCDRTKQTHSNVPCVLMQSWLHSVTLATFVCSMFGLKESVLLTHSASAVGAYLSSMSHEFVICNLAHFLTVSRCCAMLSISAASGTMPV